MGWGARRQAWASSCMRESSCITAARPDAFPEPITADAFLQQRLREIKLA